MKSQKLLDAVGDIDENYIEKANKKTISPWIKYSGVAACFLAVIMAVTYCVGRHPRYKRVCFDLNSDLGYVDCELYFDDNVSVEIELTDEFESKFPVYEITEHIITDKDLQEMREALNLPEYSKWSSLHTETNRFSGSLVDYTDFSRGYIDVSEEEFEEMAWDAFEKIPFIQGDYEYVGIQGEMTSYTLEEGTNTTRLAARFRRILDGKYIRGNDQCLLWFDGSGLVEIDITMYDYKKTGELDMIPFETAKEQILAPDHLSFKDADYNWRNKKCQSLDINKVSVVYYNAFTSQGCDILQPTYYFEGKAMDTDGIETDVIMKIIAIPEKYTYN